jgi:hypothetical protein
VVGEQGMNSREASFKGEERGGLRMKTSGRNGESGEMI